MKIIFLIPPFQKIYGKFQSLYRRGFLNPPMSFAYLAASLEKAGHNVMIIDGEAQSYTDDDIINGVREYSPDLIGLTATSPTYDITLDFARIIKELFPEVPLVLGGTHITIFQKAVLDANPVFDFGVIADGEDTVCELAEALRSTKKYSSINGLIWRDGESIVQNEIRPLQLDLDKYFFPARHLLKNELYVRNIPYKGYRVSASFMASRGCPYNCIYCAVKNIPGGNIARFRSAANITEELEIIIKRLGIRHIAFNDDCLTFRKDIIFELCRQIKKRKLKFTWEGLSRADRVDKEIISEMKSAGLIRLCIGIESGNQKILDILNKNERLEDIARGIKIVHEAGVIVRGSVIIGSPYETLKEVEDTFRFINSLKGLDQVVINIMQPYPGTKVRDMVLRGEGGTRIVGCSFGELRRFGNASMEVNDLSANKLVYLQRRGMRQFYLNPRKIIRNLVINHPLAFVIDAYGASRSIFW